jgi:hypothetical protein
MERLSSVRRIVLRDRSERACAEAGSYRDESLVVIQFRTIKPAGQWPGSRNKRSGSGFAPFAHATSLFDSRSLLRLSIESQKSGV